MRFQPILNTIFSKFSGGAPDPLEGLKKVFSPPRGSKIFFRIDFLPKQKILDRTLSSVSPLPLPDIMEVGSLRGKIVLVKQPIKMVIVMVMHYFHSVLEHGLPPSLNLNHNSYSTLPRIHVRRESMARGTKEHFNFARA